MSFPQDIFIWLIAALGALLIGLGKGGLPGIGNISIAIYALIFPAKLSVGILLPILIVADIVAVYLYRRHALWYFIRKLLPWAWAGVVMGYLLLGVVQDDAVRAIIGWTLLLMTAAHFIRLYLIRHSVEQSDSSNLPQHSGTGAHRMLAGSTGICGGLASMVANAAGPIAALYH